MRGWEDSFSYSTQSSFSGELEWSDTDTARQYTLYLSDSEDDLTSEQNNSSTVETVNLVKSGSLLETPD